MTWTRASATCNLGAMSAKGQGVAQDVGKALEFFEQAHQAGDVDATFNLGAMYAEGQGTAQDFGKALELHEQTHLGGTAEAPKN